MFLPFRTWIEQDTESYILANSANVNIGDAVYFRGAAGSGAFVTPIESQTNSVYGVVVGFAQSPGGTDQGSLFVQSLAAPSSNQTVAMFRARVLPVREGRLFLADLTQTAGTTTGSGDPGGFFINNTNGRQLIETTYQPQVAATSSQFFSIGSGLSPTTSGVGFFPASQSQVVGFFTVHSPRGVAATGFSF